MSKRDFTFVIEDWTPLDSRVVFTVVIDIQQLGRVVFRSVYATWDEPQAKWQLHWPTRIYHGKEQPVASFSGAFAEAVLNAVTLRMTDG